LNGGGRGLLDGSSRRSFLNGSGRRRRWDWLAFSGGRGLLDGRGGRSLRDRCAALFLQFPSHRVKFLRPDLGVALFASQDRLTFLLSQSVESGIIAILTRGRGRCRNGRSHRLNGRNIWHGLGGPGFGLA
jgi:hypothetical protein